MTPELWKAIEYVVLAVLGFLAARWTSRPKPAPPQLQSPEVLRLAQDMDEARTVEHRRLLYELLKKEFGE